MTMLVTDRPLDPGSVQQASDRAAGSLKAWVVHPRER